MDRRAVWVPTLIILVLLAVASLSWGVGKGLTDGADLLRRAEEVRLFVAGTNPYQDPDMTYPPTALPVFTPLVAPLEGNARLLRAAWLVLNLAALGLLCGVVVRVWGRGWPGWLRAVVCLTIVASKPVRGGMALGQFHLIPLLLVLMAVAAVQQGKSKRAGVWLGLALAKPTMVVPFLGLLAVRGRWRALAVAGLVQAAAMGLVWAWLGIGPVKLLRDWLANARTQEGQGMIDLPSLVGRAWPGAPISGAAMALVVLAVGFVAMLALRRRSDLALLGFAGFVSATFTYHRPYDLVLLVPALVFLVDSAWKAEGRVEARVRGGAAVLLAALLISPSHPSVTGRLEAVYDRLFVGLAYGLFGLLIVLLIRKPKENPEAAKAALGATGLAERLAAGRSVRTLLRGRGPDEASREAPAQFDSASS